MWNSTCVNVLLPGSGTSTCRRCLAGRHARRAGNGVERDRPQSRFAGTSAGHDRRRADDRETRTNDAQTRTTHEALPPCWRAGAAQTPAAYHVRPYAGARATVVRPRGCRPRRGYDAPSWRRGRVVRQRPAKPRTAVRIRSSPSTPQITCLFAVAQVDDALGPKDCARGGPPPPSWEASARGTRRGPCDGCDLRATSRDRRRRAA